MTCLSPTVARIGCCGLTGPSLCTMSLAMVGAERVSTERLLAIAKPRTLRESENIGGLLQVIAQGHLELTRTLGARSDSRCDISHVANGRWKGARRRRFCSGLGLQSELQARRLCRFSPACTHCLPRSKRSAASPEPGRL